MDTNSIFSKYFSRVLDYVRGNDEFQDEYIDFLNYMKDKLGDQQYDPNEDIEDLERSGFILNNMKVQNIYQPRNCGKDSSQVSMILVAPNKTSDTLENMLNTKGLFQRISPQCSRQIIVKNPYGGKYLVIGIQRNEDGQYKNRTPVLINDVISMRNSLYRIRSIIIHCGSSVDKGHYIVFLLNDADGSWYLYDDNKTPVKINLNYFDFINHPFKCGCGFLGLMKNSGTIVGDSTTLLYERV